MYRDLYTLGDSFERVLKDSKDTGAIGDYSVDVVPDDLRVEIVIVKRVPIKNIKCTVVVQPRENTDNEK